MPEFASKISDVPALLQASQMLAIVVGITLILRIVKASDSGIAIKNLDFDR